VEPSISCVIPVYNDKARLPRAVQSALQQRAGVQVVLVDDGSTDGSRELALDMARDDPRIYALALPANRGQGFARNVGAAATQAPYLTFLDQDDEHAPGWYDHALALLDAHPHYAAVRGDIELRDVPADLALGRDDPRWSAMVSSTIWNVVMRRSAFQAIGGCPVAPAYRTREGAEDVTVAIALRQYFSVARTPFVATRHYVGEKGATAYFLRRTRVVGGRIEFLESTEAEESGVLASANAEYQRAAAANVEALRTLLAREPAPAAPSGGWISRVTGALLRRMIRD
jgi:glycosyltransferase involved in cell wall biosynthesis